MKEANKFFNGMMDNGKDFNKCKVGQVVKFDAGKMKADIQPLPSSENSLLINVPVMTFLSGSFFIKIPLEVGDTVLVLFADNDLDDILLGGDSNATGRKHDLSDAICIGGINLFNESLGGDSTELTLGTKDLKGMLSISKDGEISIKGEKITISGKNESKTWE